MNRFLLICFLIFPISFSIFVPLVSLARDVTLVPSIDIRGEYNDNVTFTRTNKKDDFLATISPGFSLNYVTELLDLQSNITLDLLRYLDETNLNTENQRYELDAGYQLMDRYTLSGNFSYVKDTTLESELEETGLVSVREDRERYKAGTGLSYQISEISDMSVTYDYAKIDYDWAGNVDYDLDAVILSYNRQFNNRLDVFTLQLYYSQTDSEASEVNNSSLSLGWSHLFSEHLRLAGILGARNTKIEYTLVNSQLIFDPTSHPPFRVTFREVKEKDTNWGGVVDINLNRTGETSSTRIGYSRNLAYSSFGEPIETDKIYLDASWMITRRFGVRFYGDLYLTKSEGTFVDEDSRYFEVRPSLNYKITENHSFHLSYSHSSDSDKTRVNNREADRNRIWFTLNFKFPKKW